MIDDKIAEKLDQIQADQAHMRAELAALRATVEATMQRHASEIEVLFDRLAEIDRRVGEIERSYVPRTLHERDVDANAEEHGRFAQSISDQRARGAWIAGGAAAVLGIIGLLVWALEKIWSRSG